MKVRQEGDDLGGIWYIFTNASMVDIINYLLREKYLVIQRYEVIDVFKRWRWFRPNETYVVLEKIKDAEEPPKPGSIDEKWEKLGKSLRKHITEHA